MSQLELPGFFQAVDEQTRQTPGTKVIPTQSETGGTPGGHHPSQLTFFGPHSRIRGKLLKVGQVLHDDLGHLESRVLLGELERAVSRFLVDRLVGSVSESEDSSTTRRLPTLISSQELIRIEKSRSKSRAKRANQGKRNG